MSSERPRLGDATRHLAPAWTDERTERALAGLHVRRKRRQVVRGVSAAAVVCGLVVGGYAVSQRDGDAGDTRATAPATDVPPAGHRLADGSVVEAATPDARFRIVLDSAERVNISLTRGAVRVSRPATAGDATGTVTINSHEVSIRIYAPSVWASHSAIETVVAPVRGHVFVVAPGASRRVTDGERARFPVRRAGAAPEDVTAPKRTAGAHASAERGDPAAPTRKVPGVAPGVDKPARGPARSRHTWRKLATRGKFAEAYRLLEAAGPDSVRDRVDDLMLAADVARMSGHPADAVRPLSRVMTGFPRDTRASVAAFTVGRIHLDELGQPIAAARAFRRAQTLAPKGPLAEDALAREVQAWAKAGKRDLARLRAREYLGRYPHGHRRSAVKQYAGL